MVNSSVIYLEGKFCDDNCLLVSVETLLSLFVLKCCDNLDVDIVFTSKCKGNSSVFKIQKISYNIEYKKFEECPSMIQNCTLPALKVRNENIVVVGLSASLRYVLLSKAERDPDHISNRLLGFRKSCLQACAEVSVWTKFCEVDIVEMIKDIYFNYNSQSFQKLSIPVHIIRYEKHLQKPPILHNALRRKQEHFEKTLDNKTLVIEMKKLKLNELPDLEHVYAEGIDFSVADLLLYVSFTLCFHRLGNMIEFEKVSPHVIKWLSELNKLEIITKGKSIFSMVMEQFPPFPSKNDIEIIYPEVPDESLYKSDPNRYKPRWRSFTHQEDIDKVMNILEKKISFEESQELSDILFHKLKSETLNAIQEPKSIKMYSLQFEKDLVWESYPDEVVPLEGDLPLSRFERKCQQLESLAQIVISLAKEGDKIVDFCSGGGHLAILLAHCLPNCKLLLVENKKNSLDKAIRRVKKLNLENVEFYQCNLDYFAGDFDIGICLHACGVATDLIMQKCCNQLSRFVCSPCCYGSVRPNHVLSYPRSSLYREELNVSLPEFLILGHAADQTHGKDNPKTDQGKKCMGYVDFDRLSYAKEIGYKTYLCIMNPPECTPKNHVLVGIC
ncbi:UNVERIFIED_CONTAM: hypothetical protein RMT77_016446 [Armadillidium vulgare]